VLVQTLGITSLLYIAIGYWAGRLREVRDPAHGLVPLAAGAAAHRPGPLTTKHGEVWSDDWGTLFNLR